MREKMHKKFIYCIFFSFVLVIREHLERERGKSVDNFQLAFMEKFYLSTANKKITALKIPNELCVQYTLQIVSRLHVSFANGKAIKN